jgi:hypothetical protein
MMAWTAGLCASLLNIDADLQVPGLAKTRDSGHAVRIVVK